MVDFEEYPEWVTMSLEVQLAHERSEDAYAVYLMDTEDGCLYSKRYEYDSAASRLRCKTEAQRDFERLLRMNPTAESYSEV